MIGFLIIVHTIVSILLISVQTKKATLTGSEVASNSADQHCWLLCHANIFSIRDGDFSYCRRLKFRIRGAVACRCRQATQFHVNIMALRKFRSTK